MVEPYVSLEEVKFSATASAIDFSNLIENASQSVQDRSLYELIIRASSKADAYTMGVYGSLCATSNTENGRYYMNRSGQIVINPYFTPILEIQNFMVGWGPGDGLQNISLSTSNCSIERTQFIITSQSTMGLYFGNLGIVGGNMQSGTEVFCQWTYVNGWANTFTNATSALGATSITVNNVTGIYPGQHLTIWDGQQDEYIQVSTSWVPGNTTLILANPLKYKHGSGVNVSALPASVKQAVIHFVVALIKERGQGGLVLNEIGEPSPVSSRQQSSMTDEALGYDLLDEFKQIWGRA
jgi:hypothetical protein